MLGSCRMKYTLPILNQMIMEDREALGSTTGRLIKNPNANSALNLKPFENNYACSMYWHKF